MKKLVFLLAVFCLLTIGAFAQAKISDYSGEWSLDKGKSKLTGRIQNVESMTMTVTQTEKELKVATATKRGAPPQGGPSGGPPPQGGAPGAGGPPPGGGGPGGGGGRGMGGGLGMGDQTTTYSLDGKETSTEGEVMGGGSATIKTTAKADGGKLNLTSVRDINSQMGEFKITTRETWEFQADGSLKVKRETETPRGTDSSDLVFTKKTK